MHSNTKSKNCLERITEAVDTWDLSLKTVERLTSDLYKEWRFKQESIFNLTLEERMTLFLLSLEDIHVLMPGLKVNIYALEYPLYLKMPSSSYWRRMCACLSSTGTYSLIYDKHQISQTSTHLAAWLCSGVFFPSIVTSLNSLENTSTLFEHNNFSMTISLTCSWMKHIFKTKTEDKISHTGRMEVAKDNFSLSLRDLHADYLLIECVSHVKSLFSSTVVETNSISNIQSCKFSSIDANEMRMLFDKIPFLRPDPKVQYYYRCDSNAVSRMELFPFLLVINATQMVLGSTHPIEFLSEVELILSNIRLTRFELENWPDHYDKNLMSQRWVYLIYIYYRTSRCKKTTTNAFVSCMDSSDDYLDIFDIWSFYADKIDYQHLRLLLPLLSLDEAEYFYNNNLSGKDIVSHLFPDVKDKDLLSPLKVLSRVIVEYRSKGAPLRLPLETLVKFTKKISLSVFNHSSKIDHVSFACDHDNSAFYIQTIPCPRYTQKAVWACINHINPNFIDQTSTILPTSYFDRVVMNLNQKK